MAVPCTSSAHSQIRHPLQPCAWRCCRARATLAPRSSTQRQLRLPRSLHAALCPLLTAVVTLLPLLAVQAATMGQGRRWQWPLLPILSVLTAAAPKQPNSSVKHCLRRRRHRRCKLLHPLAPLRRRQATRMHLLLAPLPLPLQCALLRTPPPQPMTAAVLLLLPAMAPLNLLSAGAQRAARCTLLPTVRPLQAMYVARPQTVLRACTQGVTAVLALLQTAVLRLLLH